MQHKYSILTRSKRSILFWCQPSKKVLFLVSAAFLCLLCMSLLGLNCLSSEDQRFLCPIFFKKRTSGFEPLAYHIEVDPKVLTSSDVDETTTTISSHNDDFKEENITISELQRIIHTQNNIQTVWNEDKFGPITSDTIIIVVQAHNRLQYLQALIQSLERAKYIENTLLVFSHGFYSEEINNAVRSIQFARVLQIFYPYGLQTHPNTFPGFSPNDCPHGTSKEKIAEMKCFGRPRDVQSLQVKHHWWWKMNMVFNGLRATKFFNGLFFFLEEDHYVFPDFIHVLRLMKDILPEKCPECNILGLGLGPKHTTVNDYRGKADKLHVVQWNNMGYAFDRQFWSGLNSQRCSDMFCEYNDYNWDFTLAYLSHKCLPHELKPLNVVSSRVFHTGDCGIHFHGKNCSDQKSLRAAQTLQQEVSEFLFPPSLTVLSTYHYLPKVDGHNGGWDDPRDIQFCKNITQQLRWQ